MTRAVGFHGPQAECDACFEAAWYAELDRAPNAPTGYIDARADQARADGLHPCTNHK